VGRYRCLVPHHLEPVPSPRDLGDHDAEWALDPPTEVGGDGPPEGATPARPPWWRWVAIAVVVAMVVAGPVAFVVARLLD
jgi:hypothetical protein